MPNAVHLTGRQVREIWQGRFRDKGAGHPYWLYTHIPFCPQICSFCQCSTSLRKSDQQVATYLEWLEGEIDFLADVAAGGLVRFQYVGGGSPNLLSEAQLEHLLGSLNRRVHFAPDSRRTFEFLPSSLRADTLPLIRSLGFNRLSCGVQSWDETTLQAVNRSRDGMEELGRTIEQSYALGYDEFNLDLICGIGSETQSRFLDGLLRALELGPTTVTVHNIIPTPRNPVFATVREELASFAAFEALQQTLGESVARRFPEVEWVLRPNSWILVDHSFRRGPSFSPWYYSDNERIHIDMLSFGRFAYSNAPGHVAYENLSIADRYDADEASYRAFRKTPEVDAALDLITDLVGDRGSDLMPIARRYGDDSLRPLRPVLEQLREQGLLRERSGRWEPVESDGVFVDDFWPLLEAAVPAGATTSTRPSGDDLKRGVQLGEGDHSLLVFIEERRTDRRYFEEVGRLGVYYRHLCDRPSPEGGAWVDGLMADFLAEMHKLLDELPNLAPKDATARLKMRLSARSS